MAECDENAGERDEDAVLAAALAMTSGDYQGDENLEAQVLACRCLANLMEALPGVAHTVVCHGAIPVLCVSSSLVCQTHDFNMRFQTMEKIQRIRGVWSIIRNCLGYSDQRLVVSIIRVVATRTIVVLLKTWSLFLTQS